MRGSATPNRSRIRHPANAGTVRARIALVLFVGLTLTTICQGHDTGEHRLAPHLAFLGETEVHGDRDPHAALNSDTDAGPMHSVGNPGAPGAHDVTSLGVVLPLLALFGLRTARRGLRPGDAHPQAATIAPPEPPPPEQV